MATPAALLLVPLSFDGLNIDGSGGIKAQTFTLPTPIVLSKIVRSAGGRLIDLDYGVNADVLPSPFTCRFFFEATSGSQLRTYVESLLVSKLGNTGTFIATGFGGSTQYSCTAQMQAPNITLTGLNLHANTIKLANVPVTFIPTIDWVAVVP